MPLRDTVAARTIERVGFRDAPKVLSFIGEWMAVHRDLGHEPSVEEFAVWWKVTARTVYRSLALYRTAWPDHSTPSDLLAAVGIDPTSDLVPHPMTMPAPAIT